MQTMTWDRVQQDVLNDDENKYSGDIDTRTLIIKSREANFQKATGKFGYRSFKLSLEAEKSLCEGAGVPHQLLSRMYGDSTKKGVAEAPMPESADGLLTWAARNQVDRSEVYARFRSREVRGLLPSSQATVENSRLIDAAKKAVSNLRYDFEPLPIALHDSRMVLRVVSKKFASFDSSALKTGESLFPGFVLVNSETHPGQAFVESFVFRSFCTNGMVFGKQAENSRALNDAGTMTQTQLVTVLERSMSKTLFDGRRVIDSVTNLRKAKVVKPKTMLKNIAAQQRWDKDRIRLLWGAWEREPSNTRWGVLNALTRAAQSAEPVERFEMERYAGNLMVSGEHIWARLVQVAA